jgi:uncharacterized protein
MAPYTKAKPAGTPTWVDLTTPNADAARSFYRTLFGWEYDIGGPEFGGYTTARLGQHSTAGLTEPPSGTPPMPASWNLYFASDDLDADVARAVALGATQLYPAMQIGEFGAMATLHDPTGAMFSFWKAGSHVGHQIDGQPGAVAWFELYSADAKAARDFYTALLGATSEPMPGDFEYYVLKHGANELAGIMQIDPSWGALPSQWMTYFAVDDADKALATITEHGGKAMSGIDDSPFGRLAAVADPAGAQFKIIQLPAAD